LGNPGLLQRRYPDVPGQRHHLQIPAQDTGASMAVMSFYPIILNTARSVRTTVEALEARGFNHAAIDARSRKIRLGYLRFKGLDYAVVAGSATVIALAYWAGVQWPIYRL